MYLAALLRGTYVLDLRASLHDSTHMQWWRPGGKKCLCFHTSFVQSHLPIWKNSLFFLPSDVYGREAFAYCFTVCICKLFGCSAFYFWGPWAGGKAQNQVIWSGKTTLMYCSFSLFSLVTQPPTVFSTLEVWTAVQSKNITTAKDMSNLNSSICIQSLTVQHFLKREYTSQFKAGQHHEKEPA